MANSPLSTPSLFQIALAGGGSGFVNSFISSPIELIKIRLQNNRTPGFRHLCEYSNLSLRLGFGATHCIWAILKSDGPMGLMRGLKTTLLRDSPSYAVYFASYEYLVSLLTPTGSDPRDLSGFRLMLAGELFSVQCTLFASSVSLNGVTFASSSPLESPFTASIIPPLIKRN